MGSKKRRRRTSTGGSARRATSPSPPRTANQPAKAGRHRGGGSSISGWANPADRRPLIGGVLGGLAVTMGATIVDPDLLAPYYVPRLVLTLALLWSIPVVAALAWDARGVRVDLIDVLTAALLTWALVSSLTSPSVSLSVLGYYNRGFGLLVILSLAVAFWRARRLGRHRVRRFLDPLAVIAAGVLIVNAVVVVAQRAGADTPWSIQADAAALVAGTTGNPVNLAGVGLLGVWLGGRALWVPGPRWMRWLQAAGAVAGLLCVLASLTRAGFLAVVVALIVALAVVAVRKRWRQAAVVGGLTAVLIAGAFVEIGASGHGNAQNRRSEGASIGERLTGAWSEGRTQLWQEAVQGFADRPVLGLGPGGFVIADRLYRPPQDRVADPWQTASDPHSAPLLLLAGVGAPGVLLALGLVVAVARRLWRRVRADTGSEATDDVEVAAAVLYTLAVAAFLAVSPVDLVTLVPLTLVVAAAAGGPVAERFSWRLPGKQEWPAFRARWIRVGTAVAAAACLLAVCVVGALWWQADEDLTAARRTVTASAAAEAADTFPWETAYALEAGAQTWREGLEAGDAEEIRSGVRYLDAAWGLDATAPSVAAERLRLAIAEGDYDSVRPLAEEGLAWNTHHPILEGLWAFSAYQLLDQGGSPEQATELMDGLMAIEPQSPDAWFWLSQAYRKMKEKKLARAARDRSLELAPRLNAKAYVNRLLRPI